MCNACKYFIYVVSCCSYFMQFNVNAESPYWHFKNCTATEKCPENSICTKVHDDLGCVCWQGFHLNPAWTQAAHPLTDYCLRGASNTTSISYTRLPAKTDELAIAIVLVLLGVIITVLILYGLVILRPINRSKLAYRRLKLRRSRHQRLEEFDDIDMTFSDTHPVYS